MQRGARACGCTVLCGRPPSLTLKTGPGVTAEDLTHLEAYLTANLKRLQLRHQSAIHAVSSFPPTGGSEE
jgi:hypothetical protein